MPNLDELRQDYGTLNIVEIGRCYVKHLLPQTKCFMSLNPGAEPASMFEPLLSLPAALADRKLDLVIVYPQAFVPWDLRFLMRKLFNLDLLKGYFPLKSAIAPHFLRGKVRGPLAVVDLEDHRHIQRNNLFLLDRAAVYFKRELPVDHWQMFALTDHFSLPTGRYRSALRRQSRIDKLLPISLGPKLGSEHEFPAAPVQKTADVFFAGQVETSSTVRRRGMVELLQLRAKGVRVDIPEGRIERPEFFKRAAAAHLVWSPEGYGWECFRHYEAPLCWSVPLMNRATIERHMPLQEGVHAVYYEPEPGGLTKAVHAALADCERLTRMASAAHTHVSQHHMHPALVRRIIETTLARSGRQFPGRIAEK